MTNRRAFALHVVLWVMLAAGAVAMGGAVLGRDGFGAASNRLALERAHWHAVECAERARAAADEVLGSSLTSDDAARAWRDLAERIAPSLRDAGCDVTAEAAGTRVNVNSASTELLGHLVDEARADSIVARRGRQPFADVRELRRVSPALSVANVGQRLTVEPGRVSLNSAPPAVLGALPGFSDEAVDAIMEIRRRGEQITDLLVVLSKLSQPAASALLARFPDLARLTTVNPDAWIVTASAGAAASPVRANIELRLVRADRRAVVARYRSWP